MASTVNEELPSVVNPSDLILNEEATRVFQKLTGIQREDDLRAHLVAVATEALRIFRYPCIRLFYFTRLDVGAVPWYKDVLALGSTRLNALLLDVGSCFGDNLRKLAVDGFPIVNMIATDLKPEFWDLGHKVFCSTKTTFPVPFIQGDILDPSFLPDPPPAESIGRDESPSPTPDIANLRSLRPLQHRVSVIHASYLFNVFTKEDQITIAHRLAALLSPEPGSIVFGRHVTTDKDYVLKLGRVELGYMSPASWVALWDGTVFAKGSVEMQVICKPYAPEHAVAVLGRPLDSDASMIDVFWFVRRL